MHATTGEMLYFRISALSFLLQMWLVLGSGNANFFYAMNLLWAGWQAVALLQLLKAGVRKDAATA